MKDRAHAGQIRRSESVRKRVWETEQLGQRWASTKITNVLGRLGDQPRGVGSVGLGCRPTTRGNSSVYLRARCNAATQLSSRSLASNSGSSSCNMFATSRFEDTFPERATRPMPSL